MHAQPADFGFLSLAVVLMATAVISVAIARRIRLSAIVAYLAAGVLIGPWGVGFFRAPDTILAVAELGVVLLLFLIGLELDFSRLFAMRRDIFGLGAAQLALTTAAIAALALAAGLGWRGAIIAGIALALSATAIALRILDERGHLQQTYGQRAFAILLFQDMSVVPLLALLPLLAPGGASSGGDWGADLLSVGRGAALLMQAVGMSMALGAFLAGVLLAGSNYRHELEADVEPFRGLLLALFFMGIGMTIDLSVVRAKLWLILAAAVVLTAVKAAIVFLLFRTTCSRRDALRAGSVLTGTGEFAFVLLPLGVSLGMLSGPDGSLVTAIAVTR